MGTDTLGVVMVLAMLFLPAATALPWVARIPAAMVVTVILGLLFLAVGTVLSIEMGWPLSQSVGGRRIHLAIGFPYHPRPGCIRLWTGADACLSHLSG